VRNGSLLARPRPPQRDWHHVGAALTHLVTPNARAPPNRATPTMSGYTAVAASEQDAKQREMVAPAMRANPAVLVPLAPASPADTRVHRGSLRTPETRARFRRPKK